MPKKRKARKKRSVENLEDVLQESRRRQLCREIEMGDVNARRLRKLWRDKMMSLNLPVIKEDVQVAWRTFDRALDNKDYSISILLDALNEVEDQKRNSDNIHTTQIDGLINACKKHLKEWGNKYRCNVEKEFQVEHDTMDEVIREQSKTERYLQTVVFITTQRFERSIENINTKNLTRLDTRKEENENIQRMSEAILKRRLLNFSKELAGVLRDYEESVKDRRKEYKVIEKKDAADQKIIAQQAIRLEKLYNNTVELRNRIEDYKENAERRLAFYKFEQDYFQTINTAMQKRLQAEQALDREKLRFLAVQYNTTLEYLKNNLTKLNKNLILINLCRKYEIYRDKIVTYPITMLSEKYPTNLSNLSTYKPMHKLIKVMIFIQKDINELKTKIEYHNTRFNYLKQSLRVYMTNFANSIPTCKKENCNAVPVLINPKELIKKYCPSIKDTDDFDNVLLNKIF